MKKRLITLLSIFFLAVIVLAACGNSNNEANSGSDSGSTNSDSNEAVDAVTLRLAENQPEDYPTTIGAKKFAELVEEKTDGRYKIDVYAGAQLGDEKSAVEQLQLGSIDLARVNATPLTEFSSDIGVLSLPYLFENEEEKWEHLTGDIGRELL